MRSAKPDSVQELRTLPALRNLIAWDANLRVRCAAFGDANIARQVPPLVDTTFDLISAPLFLYPQTSRLRAEPTFREKTIRSVAAVTWDKVDRLPRRWGANTGTRSARVIASFTMTSRIQRIHPSHLEPSLRIHGQQRHNTRKFRLTRDSPCARVVVRAYARRGHPVQL